MKKSILVLLLFNFITAYFPCLSIAELSFRCAAGNFYKNVGQYGGQCVKYVQDETGIYIRGNANTWYHTAENSGYATGNIPIISSIIVFDIQDNMPYGHVGIVTSVSGSNVTIRDSNWHPKTNPEIIYEHTVNINNYDILGYIYCKGSSSGSKPDLVVRELYLSDHRRTFLPGEDFRIHAKIKNIGKGDVDHDVTIRYYRSKGEKIDASGDRVSLGTDNIRESNMESGDSQWEDKDTSAPQTPGLYNITVRVDDEKKISESDEDNNWFDPPLTCTVVSLPPPNWSIVQQLGDPAVYIFYNGKKWWAVTWDIIYALGFAKKQLIIYPSGSLNGYPNGIGVVTENLLGQLGNAIYLFQNGNWCYLPDWSYMDCRGGQHPENVIPITAELFNLYGQGPDVTPCYVPMPPAPNFTAAPTNGRPPLTVAFTNVSTGNITSWFWDFGDGNTSSEPGPTHIYTTPGTYTVKLTATGPEGQVTETKTHFITVIAPHEAKLIQNGSFEVGPRIPIHGFASLSNGDTYIQGWTVGGHGVDLVGKIFWQSSDGNNSVDLSSTDTGSLSQTFPTIPGVWYSLRFDLAGNPVVTPAVKNLRVKVSGVSRNFTFDTTGKTFTNMSWVTKSLSFKASSSLTTLVFESLDNTAGGPVIDNVRVYKHSLLPLKLLLSD